MVAVKATIEKHNACDIGSQPSQRGMFADARRAYLSHDKDQNTKTLPAKDCDMKAPARLTYT